MKKTAYVAALLAAVCMVSCQKDSGSDTPGDGRKTAFDPFAGEKATSYTGYAEMSVPSGTTEVYVEYTKDGSTEVFPVAVSPVVATPEGGKDVDPFGTVKLLFSAPVQTKVSVYYKAGGVVTKADEDAIEEDVYTLTDFPVDKVQNDGHGPGISRYFHVAWDLAYMNNESTGWQNAPAYPKDLLYYDAERNHTLRYKFAYSGTGNGAAYFLDEAYTIDNYVVTGVKYDYCGGCGNCAFCMPWGCSCGCAGWNGDGTAKFRANEGFVPSGDTTGNAGEGDIVIGGEGEGGEGGSSEPIVIVDNHGTIIVDYDNSNINEVTLPEPASYVTKDEDQTFYHSSGVVMFDDSWPASPVRTSAYDSDFNDVVVDYDIEAKTVADNILESEGWREQVKVVLHIRAIGGENPERVGLILEGFNLDNVASIEEYKTLDSWQNAHGELPTSQHMNAVKENSFQVKVNSLRPLSEVGQLFRYRETGSGAGTATYNYVNNGQSQEHVFNPALKQYAAWGGAHADQYDAAALEQAYKEVGQNFSNIQSRVFYNTVPGYVNVAGGLYTYTVIYNMKARAEMDPAAREAVKKNMIDAVVNTTSQNFYIVSKSGGQYYPIHLKGYTPADFPVKGFGTGNTYKDRYEAGKAGKSYLNATIPYCTTDNLVWAFKCPTLTKHAWEKMAFGKAYPNYEAWVRSNGAEHQDWYKDADVNGTLLTCWW